MIVQVVTSKQQKSSSCQPEGQRTDSQNFREQLRCAPSGLREVLGPGQVLSWALCPAEQAGRARPLGNGASARAKLLVVVSGGKYKTLLQGTEQWLLKLCHFLLQFVKIATTCFQSCWAVAYLCRRTRGFWIMLCWRAGIQIRAEKRNEWRGRTASKQAQAVCKYTLSSQYDQDQSELNQNSMVFQVIEQFQSYLTFKSMQTNLNLLSKPHLELPSSQMQINKSPVLPAKPKCDRLSHIKYKNQHGAV